MFFVEPETGEMKAVEFTVTQTEFWRGAVTTLFTVPNTVRQLANASFYDVALDDERFLMVRQVEEAGAPRLILVLNFFGELERLVPTN